MSVAVKAKRRNEMRSKLMRPLVVLAVLFASLGIVGGSAQGTPVPTVVSEGCGDVIQVEGLARVYPSMVHLISGCVHYAGGRYTISGSYTIDKGQSVTAVGDEVPQPGSSLITINSGTLNVSLVKPCITYDETQCDTEDATGSASVGTMDSNGFYTWTPLVAGDTTAVPVTAGMQIRFDNVTVKMKAGDDKDVELYALGTFLYQGGGGPCASACFHF
jgi:hypothetical protein